MWLDLSTIFKNFFESGERVFDVINIFDLWFTWNKLEEKTNELVIVNNIQVVGAHIFIG